MTIADPIKLFCAGMISTVIAYFSPIQNAIYVLAYMFVLDIIFGLLVDLIVNKDRLRIKKLLVSLFFLSMYMTIIVSTYFIGKMMDDTQEAMYIVKVITYVFSYCYLSNTIRNMKELAPNSKAIAFLDYFIGLQLLKRLPEVAAFFGIKEKKENPND